MVSTGVKACAMFALLAVPLAGQPAEVRLRVVNASEIARPQEPIIVPWSVVATALPGSKEASVTVSAESGRFLMSQVDDLDADGTPDELVFVADFAAKQEHTFILRLGAAPTGHPAPPVRTDAGNWKKGPGGYVSIDDDDGPGLLRSQSSYRFDGVGWESELTGYRLYLDERNALDIQGKRIPGLYWNHIGSSSIDYQADAEWGTDVLHVGPALGAGGFGFWDADSVVKPYDVQRRRARILARGPVRVVVRVDYFGWKVGADRLNATSIYTMYAGEASTEHQLTIAGTGSRTIATGLVKHAQAAVTWDRDSGTLRSEGKQARSGGSLQMSIHVRPGDVQKVTADKWNDLVLLRAEAGKALRYVVSNRWEGESARSGVDDADRSARIHARLLTPLVAEPVR